MTEVERLLGSVGLACDYYKDVAAIASRPPRDGLFFDGLPVTPGFGAIRERAHCLNLQLLLADGSVGLGDCLSVIRSGSHDREGPLKPEDHLARVGEELAPSLTGRTVRSFRELAGMIDQFESDGRPLHHSLAYGLSQAMLDAVAAARRCTMAEVVAEEYGLPRPDVPVALFGCTSWDVPDAVDRLIAGRADVLPHGGFTSVDLIGPDGEGLLDYVRWMAARIRKHGGAGYRPVLHLDVYGTIGALNGNRIDRVVSYFARLAEAASPFRVRVEDPVTAATSGQSRQLMRRLVEHVDRDGMGLEVVADEYCNTREDIALWAGERAAHMIHVKLPDLGSLTNAVEAVLQCRKAGVGAYVGGTMNDTEVSARAGVHLALALRADQVMAKPGAWPDVSLALSRNEMNRTLRLCALRGQPAS
ncbi:methylaspartate ammonia-lyase [Amycolatopsis rubida]|uniref:methylaspartate ammonia-lyase n=1 Tax=Amycolatopsis rubida TaxID=112413 RepID=A0ABX0C6W9_9PSEU|nr:MULTISPECIES: methylaspartate ammonia-lyase [Amycolatopsis]MYW96181.1 methylaspartate ammonia-lyase [Amycolatopsis rubida]NEC61172.1 methylaspartate ammonia-lyase [Amycolatopsis rubida]OAP24303.1 Methylaspartate ammonia-lyase [Amycolatopsis sp. M39]